MRNLAAGDKIGRYEIIGKVGEGGMSVVFEGFDPTLERYVAIKLIKIESFPANLVDTVKERFVREAKALAQLNHPNIVKVFDFGEFEDAPYLVMDYLEGPTYKAIRKPVPLEAAVDLIKPVADALAYIHSKGLLHRDIKASNIILLSGNHPMLTDFGIAKWIEAKDDQLTLTGQGFGLGTPEYMSPEQGMGKAVDHRSDQYSLAIVFYELITGRRPYTDETVVAVLVKQVNEPVPDPRQFVPELSESVVKFFKIALAKNLSDRHADINTFLLDLDGLKLQAQTNRAKGATTYQVEMDDYLAFGPSTGSSVKISKADIRKVRGEEDVKAETGKKMTVDKAKKKSVWIGFFIAIAVLLGFIGGIKIGGRAYREKETIRVITATIIKDAETMMAHVTVPTLLTPPAIKITPDMSTETPMPIMTVMKSLKLTTALTFALSTETPLITQTSMKTEPNAWADASVIGVTSPGIYNKDKINTVFRNLQFMIDPGKTDVEGHQFVICQGSDQGKCELVNGILHCSIPDAKFSTSSNCFSLYSNDNLQTCSQHDWIEPVFEDCAKQSNWNYLLTEMRKKGNPTAEPEESQGSGGASDAQSPTDGDGGIPPKPPSSENSETPSEAPWGGDNETSSEDPWGGDSETPSEDPWGGDSETPSEDGEIPQDVP